MMSERPIIFSEESVKSILKGRKTQTRRVIKPQPAREKGYWYYRDLIFTDDEFLRSHLFHNVYGANGSPYGAIYGPDNSADRLWVREAFRELIDTEGGHNFIAYKADGEIICQYDPDLSDSKWRPSIYMPRRASRVTLQLTDIRIERLQEASLADLIAEGCPVEHLPENCNGMNHAVFGWFESSWDAINYKRGFPWASNPWVWVIEFKVI